MSDEADRKGTIRIGVDRTICAGHGLCVMRAPEVYQLDDEGFCISDGNVVAADLRKQAELGALVCPEGAIKLETAE